MIQPKNIGLCVLFTILSCGFYGFYWLITLTDDANRFSNNPSPVGGGMTLLLGIITCGLYYFFWAYKLGENLDMARANSGQPTSNLGGLYVVLVLLGLGIVVYCLAQSEVNKYAGQ